MMCCDSTHVTLIIQGDSSIPDKAVTCLNVWEEAIVLHFNTTAHSDMTDTN